MRKPAPKPKPDPQDEVLAVWVGVGGRTDALGELVPGVTERVVPRADLHPLSWQIKE